MFMHNINMHMQLMKFHRVLYPHFLGDFAMLPCFPPNCADLYRAILSIKVHHDADGQTHENQHPHLLGTLIFLPCFL